MEQTGLERTNCDELIYCSNRESAAPLLKRTWLKQPSRYTYSAEKLHTAFVTAETPLYPTKMRVRDGMKDS
jgi:hypothetical protein